MIGFRCHTCQVMASVACLPYEDINFEAEESVSSRDPKKEKRAHVCRVVGHQPRKRGLIHGKSSPRWQIKFQFRISQSLMALIYKGGESKWMRCSWQMESKTLWTPLHSILPRCRIWPRNWQTLARMLVTWLSWLKF